MRQAQQDTATPRGWAPRIKPKFIATRVVLIDVPVRGEEMVLKFLSTPGAPEVSVEEFVSGLHRAIEIAKAEIAARAGRST